MRQVRTYGGFSLPELILGFGVFMLFLGAVFALFTRGYQAFHFLQTRQSVQGQLLRLKTVMEADFRLSHYRSVGFEKRTLTFAGRTVRRDQICCLTMSDWKDPASYREATGIPLWDRYAVYLTSTESEGKLERLLIAPDRPLPLRVRPLTIPLAVDDDVVGRQLLSSSLDSLECRTDPYTQEVIVTLALRESGGKRGLDDNKTSETFQADFRWSPNNTVPRF